MEYFLYNDIKTLVFTVILAVIFGSATAIFFYNSADTIPATEEDYAYFENYMYKIEQNPELIVNIPFVYKLSQDSQGNKCLFASNEECSVLFNYDKDYKITSTKREDYCIGPLTLLFMIIVLTILYFLLFIIICFNIIQILKIIIEKAKKNSIENPNINQIS